MPGSVPAVPLPSVVLPDPKRQETLQIVLKDTYAQWREAYLLAHPRPPIINVCFEHQAHWRENWLSIQNAHDGRSPVWQVTGFLFKASVLAPYGIAWLI